MNTKKILLFFIILSILLGFVVYDTYTIEEEKRNQEYFSDNVNVYDAKVNSNYLHDEKQNVRQVNFNVDVPLNRYYVETPSQSP